MLLRAITIKSVYCVGFQLLFLLINTTCSSSQSLEYYLDKLRGDVTSPPLGCGETREVSLHQAIFIESPNFSLKKKYPNSVHCKWHFHLKGCTLAISCPNFSLNKFLCFDYLEVSDGIGRTKRFCGDEGPQSLYMEGNVDVSFRSSPSFSAAGFRCYAVCVEPGPVTHTELAAPSIPFTSLGHCVCGRGNRDKKYATRENFPWIAKIFRKSDHKMFCTATLITNQYLVSASHCFVSRETMDPSDIYVVLNEEPKGRLDVDEKKVSAKRNVTSIIRYHTDGLTYEIDPDVSLLKLEDTVDFDGQLSPVCLPKGEELTKQFVATDTISSQWEWDDQWQGLHLWNVKSRVISNDNCTRVYQNTGKFRGLGVGDTNGVSPTSIFCTQSSHRYCRPISGAALMTAENKGRVSKFTQIGVGTWGYDCGRHGMKYRQNMPQMYTKLTDVMSWIITHTQDSGFCKG